MQEWLVGIVGADLAPIVSIALTALFVIVLAVIVISLLRRLMGGGMGLRSSAGPRVEVIDVTALDQKRKLVLVRRDQVEHLILIGGQNDLLVESHIGRAPPPGRRAEPMHPAMQQPAQPPRRPAPAPQAPIAQAQMPRRAPPVDAPRESPPVTIDIASNEPVTARREAPRNEPSFSAPVVETPRTEDRLDEAPREDGPPAPSVEHDRPEAEVTPETRAPQMATRPVSQPPARPAPEPVPRPAPDPVSVPAPQPIAGNPIPSTPTPRAPLATPTLPMKRANPVMPEPSIASETTGSEPPLWPQAPAAETRIPVGPSSVVPPTPPRRDPVIGERRDEIPSVRGERQPLNVRSFASAIQQRPTSAPTPPPIAPPPPVPVPASVRPVVPPVAPPVAVAEPADIIPPAADPAPRAGESEDELARALSAEFAADDSIEFQQTPIDVSRPREDLSETTDAGGAGRRELSLEEEMERLLRDFSQQTADRR